MGMGFPRLLSRRTLAQDERFDGFDVMGSRGAFVRGGPVGDDEFETCRLLEVLGIDD